MLGQVTQGANPAPPWWPRGGRRNGRWEGGRRGRGHSGLRVDSCCWAAETNTTSYSSYPPIKSKFKKEVKRCEHQTVTNLVMNYHTSDHSSPGPFLSTNHSVSPRALDLLLFSYYLRYWGLHSKHIRGVRHFSLVTAPHTQGRRVNFQAFLFIFTAGASAKNSEG